MSFKRSRAAFEAGSDGPPHHAPFAVYGTPLPAYDADARDDGSYVPVWKQEVTDERGRKRLHGAFTGGFSAGYFNTVGSKEGWAPATFVSSRAKRAKDVKDGKQQRAEDFMDEEDLAEQAESQKLETHEAFAGLGGGSADGARKGMFLDLFRMTGETKGMKLLQRMGWRPGQGIGPKVKRRAQGDAKGAMHLFAPDNTSMISFVKKNDRKGLGFAGEGKLEGGTGANTAMQDDDEDSGEDARILRTNRSKAAIKAKPVKKSGFGVGVLNDDGSDDDDPYSVGPRISYNRIIGGDKKKKKGGLLASSSSAGVIKPTSTSKKLVQRSNASSGFRKCHDGRLPLEGFVLALSALNLAEANHYPPPVIPADWKPAQQRTASESKSGFVSTSDAAKASDLTPAARASLLGEAALPGKSVFSYLTPAARERLANATQNRNLPPALGEKAPEGYVPDPASQTRTLWDLVPTLSKETAALALRRGKTGWMPYAEDDGKRERYAGFLELSAGLKSDLPARVHGHSREEWAAELREFAEAAEIFRPAEGYMALRFTTGTGKTEGGNLEEEAPKMGGAKEEDAAEKAAKMGMFGPLTRSKIPFYPTRLLCKRFNVKPPPNVMGQADDRSGGGGGGASTAPSGSDGQKRLEIVSQASLDRMMMEANFSKNFAKGGVEGGSGEPEALEPQAVKVEVDAERNEALEGKRAGEDIFKAVFGSDSEDD